MPFKNNILLLLLFLFGLMQQSCKKMDTSNFALHDKNFAENFFKTKTPLAPQVAAIIAKLKAANERTGFVNKLPKDCGLPVWEKLLFTKTPVFTDKIKTHGPSADADVTDGDSSLSAIIPLSQNNENLSSVLLVNETEGNLVTNCYTTNGYLYNICQNITDTATAQQMLTLFMYMENRVYGTTTFYHIPARFFTKDTILDNDGNKTIIIKDVPSNPDNNFK
ncbi:MAG: hypothetical protein WDM90_09830 [Ferruginibacter sp.]